jgi:predicted metal-dependent TIM-barrel fold hydrolase
MILDMLCSENRMERQRVVVDHVEEHTVRYVLDAGFWAGMTLYPTTKCTPQRAADMIEVYGPDRLMVNSSGDWGPSRPTAVRDFILEMRRRGHSEKLIYRVVYENPWRFLAQNPKFRHALPGPSADYSDAD